jgi:hypothetical protein
MATVVNTYHIAYSMHVTIIIGLRVIIMQPPPPTPPP